MISLAIVEKELSSVELNALIDKYQPLFANVGFPMPGQDKATLYLNGETVFGDWEVEFTDTPTAVTYKAKKLKKKAASFTVTAVANNGAAVKYKLIDAPAKITIDKATGTITLAKGLKKGTYKIKVKAYVPGYSDVAYETQAIKIKVKK